MLEEGVRVLQMSQREFEVSPWGLVQVGCPSMGVARLRVGINTMVYFPIFGVECWPYGE